MAFDALKEKLADEWANTYARLQENQTFIQLEERFQSLPPVGQKAILGGVAALFVLIIFSIPWGMYSAANDRIAEFEEQKALIAEMFRVNREYQALGGPTAHIEASSFTSQLQGQMSRFNVPPELQRGVNPVQENGDGKHVPKAVQMNGAQVALAKMNLTQLVDIGTALQQASNEAKMITLDIIANSEDSRYFDVTYKLVGLNIPEKAKPAEGDKDKSATAKKRPRFKDGGDE